MKKTLAVARWEYVEKIKSKAFLVSLFLMPVIMVGMGVVPTLLAGKPDTEPRSIGIIDQAGELFEPLSRQVEERYKLPGGQPNYVLERIDISNGAEDAKKIADRLVLEGQMEGYFLLKPSVLQDTVIEYRSKNVGNFRIIERFTRVLRDIIFERRLQAEGIDPAIVRKVEASLDVKTVKLSERGEEEAGFEKVFFSAYIFMMMLFFLVMTTGQLLVRSVVEEKTNRVVEILVSSCSATDLMAGKILGLSGLGFTQIGFWALIGLAISVKFGVTLITFSSALLLLVFFVLGYLFYAAIFVAAGSPISTEQEAQQITSYLVLILVLPIILALVVLQDPDSLLIKILTFIPMLTPTMMAMRIPIQMPSPIEIFLAALLLALSAYAAMWAAGKIFRTAILAYSKRPSLGEILRLLRTAN